MSAVARRTFLAFVLVLVVLTTGAWQSDQVALAESQATDPPDTPLYPGLTWSSLGLATQNIRINTNGDSISLSGERYEALEQFTSSLPEEVLNYYSNEQLARSGWASYDAFNGSDGIHYVFYHESGAYLSVEFLNCPQAPSSICVAVWQSEQTQPVEATPGTFSGPEFATVAGSFGKTAPSNGATGLNPTSTTLSWGASSGAEKYSYCVQQGSACANNDPDWTSSYDRSVTVTNLAYDKTYYWQVRATSCSACVPKPWVYANNGTVWTFRTRVGAQVTILGNAGVGGAVLSYINGTVRNVTADSVGAYSISVPLNWSGTVTPSKSGYLFSPTSASFSNLTATQTIQNFTATRVYVISGNAGLAGVTLSYVNGTPQTVLSDASGNYSIVVPSGWSGTVTPSRTSYTFAPASRTYSNVTANQTAQNYTATFITYTISGNAGVAGATLMYTNGTPQSVLADGSGNYSITVPLGWSGTVTPVKTGYLFSPVNRTYSNVVANSVSQNYTAIPLYTISGNVGVAAATLSYTDGTPRTVTSQTDGSYSLIVPATWIGTVTPTHPCFTFSPTSRSYNNPSANQTAQNYAPTLKNSSGCTDIAVSVGGASQGRFGIPSHTITRTNFSGLSNGPVKMSSSNAVSLLGAERVIYNVNGMPTSFSEMMALPDSQLDTTYWLPWYNNVDLDTQLRFGNVTGAPVTVRLYINGQEKTSGCTPSNSPYTLAGGASLRISCAGVNNGPVKFESTGNIVAAERVIYRVNNIPTSFSEMLALPDGQLDATYWLPWYNNVDLDTQLRVGNVTNQTATVHVFIHGQEMTSSCSPSNSPYTLAGGVSLRISCPGVNSGPVKIESDQNIVAAERVIYRVNNTSTSFSEMMALPDSQLNTTYWLPLYNNVDLDTQLRFGNVTTNQTATVHVYVAGQEMTSGCGPSNSPFTLLPGASLRITCSGINSGPVKIVSNVDIVAAERVIYNVNGVPTSFSEMLALPNSQLDSTYWWPWYNNLDLDTQLRFGLP